MPGHSAQPIVLALPLMHFATIPPFLKPLAGDFLWSVNGCSNEVFITFDDGPTPGVTDGVLEVLKTHQATASFFCVGQNVATNPELFESIQRAGHTIGNHTWSHPSGWSTPVNDYLNEVRRCNDLVQSKWFRPPYGRITRKQQTGLKKQYTLVMWSVLSGDYLPERSPEQCLKTLIKHTKPGAIIVFHDNVKATRNVLTVLPQYLVWLRENHYTCHGLDALNASTHS
jgi:peptidoglycan/xylan/chitin deacetylase (PgdA/CDA1 family)